jgi:hypothetical protein
MVGASHPGCMGFDAFRCRFAAVLTISGIK